MELYTSNGIFIFYSMLIIGMILVALTKGAGSFFGVLFLIGATLGSYGETQQSYMHKFALEQFKSGAELDCGFSRGDSTLISLQSDWKYRDHIGFVKGDKIIDDEHCSVIGKQTPSPSLLLYLGIFIFSLTIAVLMRSAFGPKTKETQLVKQNQKKGENDNDVF